MRLGYLQETQGVTVATLGKTNDFPAFYTPKSGYKSPWSMETAQEAARMIRAFLLRFLRRHFSHSLYCVQDSGAVSDRIWALLA